MNAIDAKTKKKSRPFVLWADWRDASSLMRTLCRLTNKRPRCYRYINTGADDIAVIVSDTRLTEKEADAAYSAWINGKG
ncbi:hypothetical protein FP828_03665 [bacterium]|nr:hypothetical protein [Candidatus Omnitrophota bacterium]MBA3065570.1 hypothetical protein [bacterium]